MGSFLVNCFVSNQVIPEESKCVIIPIVKHVGFYDCAVEYKENKATARQDFNSPCYLDSFWKPLGIKIDVVADDCGKQKLIDTKMNRVSLLIFFENIKSSAFKTEKGTRNQYHEQAFDFDVELIKTPGILAKLNSSWKYLDGRDNIPWNEFETLWEVIHELVAENRIFIRNYDGHPVQLQFAICIGVAYDYVIENASFDKYLIKDFNKVDIGKEREQVLKGYKRKDERLMTYNLFKIEVSSGYRVNYSAYSHTIIEEKLGEKDLTKASLFQLTKLHKPVHNFLVFQNALNELNVKLLPIVGATQDYDNEAGHKYAKTVLAVAKLTKEFIKKKFS